MAPLTTHATGLVIRVCCRHTRVMLVSVGVSVFTAPVGGREKRKETEGKRRKGRAGYAPYEALQGHRFLCSVTSNVSLATYLVRKLRSVRLGAAFCRTHTVAETGPLHTRQACFDAASACCHAGVACRLCTSLSSEAAAPSSQSCWSWAFPHTNATAWAGPQPTTQHSGGTSR